MKNVSIILPAFNEEKLLPASLKAIQGAMGSFTAHGWTVQLCVCDNNSTDRTAEVAREGGAEVAFEPINQISRARNTGASIARGDWFLFIDADSHPSYDLFNDTRLAMESGKLVGGGSVVALDETSKGGATVTKLWNKVSAFRGWAAGSYIFCRAEAFKAIGGFSTEFFASEEIDFSSRLKAHGIKAGQGFKILKDHPLITSARKLHLYSKWDYVWFLTKLAFRPKRILRSREHCKPWYDGRR